jgi:GMP synthase-like glutamine amidotransferase
MVNDESADSSVATLLDMIAGHRITAVIYTAAKLEIPELLDGGPKTAGEVAAKTGAHEASISRLLRALVTLGLCSPRGDGFELTAMGRRLSGNAPGSLRPWAMFEGQFLRRSWTDLLESIRTGQTAAELAGITAEQAFEQMAKSGVADVFNQAMVAVTRHVAPAVVAAYDFGMKWNILRRFTAYGCDVRVFPATAPASDLLAAGPDGVFLSNGPGDPAVLSYAISNAKTLVDSDVPVFGICLGHQVLSLAMGGDTFKLKFGHRGANHPVKELNSGKIEITSQNHGFAVDQKSLESHGGVVTHINLNDGNGNVVSSPGQTQPGWTTGAGASSFIIVTLPPTAAVRATNKSAAFFQNCACSRATI